MPYDDAASALLHEVVTDWAGAGILRPVRKVISEVWPRNLDRYEPDLGDDAMTLGVQSGRNVRNLAVRMLQEAGLDARIEDQSLRVKHAGRVLHINKVSSMSPSWHVDSQRWDDSEVRQFGAQANSQAYFPTQGALFPVRARDPQALQHLHLTWQGLEGGDTRAWIGFPRIGDTPWFAITPVAAEARAGRAGTPSTSPTTGSPKFDAMQVREPSINLKVSRGEHASAGTTGSSRQ